MSAAMPIIDLNCAICKYDTNYQKAFGRVFYKGKCYCSFRCYSEAAMKKPDVVYKICCICNVFISDFPKHTVSRGLICSNKCFHLWMEDGIAKFVQHELEKNIFQNIMTEKK